MIELVQFPWSPFCLVQRSILRYSGQRFKTVNIPSTDRELVWKLTRQRYYAVPIIKDGREVVFETREDSQVIAKYIDLKYQLGLFPMEWAGVQDIMWRSIENEIEGLTFKLNDIYFKEFVPKREILPFLRHKERKFGRGCIDQWKDQQKTMVQELEQKLVPFEKMLFTRSFLMGDRPLFVDFDLFGMLENFLYSGHYSLPSAHTRLRRWHERMSALSHVEDKR